MWNLKTEKGKDQLIHTENRLVVPEAGDGR